MDELRQYLKALTDDAARTAFADACRTSIGHLRNVSYGLRPPSAELCVAIEQASAGKVTRRDLRPSDWHLIWPELVTDEHPAPTAGATTTA